MDTESRQGPVVLLVGDWVVDEYWFLVRHHSQLSSHVGFAHYRVASLPAEQTMNLCGAGHVARVLYHLSNQPAKPYSLIGMGCWSEKDTEIIRHLVHTGSDPDCEAGTATFTLAPTTCSRPPDLRLITLKKDAPTIRVIRQYFQQDSGLEQMSRVDWEPQRSQADPALPKALAKELDGIPCVDAIVAHDLSKGVVTQQLVEKLKNRFPEAPWYVRSKRRRPAWLDVLGDRLQLLLLGPEVIAVETPWDTLVRNGWMTLQAHQLIDSLPGRNVVLLSDRRDVAARLNDKTACVTAQSMTKPTVLTQVGWPSAFFAALIHLSLTGQPQPGGPAAYSEQQIKEAITLSEEHCGVPLPLSQGPGAPDKRSPVARLVKWEEHSANWRQATANLGIITGGTAGLPTPRLEVWRASTLLPGYITCIDEKAEAISEIGRHLRAFLKGDRPRSLSILLQADPGSGKTHLAKCLAAAFDFSLLRYDVTQMTSREDLLDLFDRVATFQASRQSNLLVFVDEINALLDSAPVYSAFLSPLEEGAYMRRGSLYSLQPCAWIFAGTKLELGSARPEEKLSDFQSRMTLTEKIDFQSLKTGTNSERLNDQARLEQVYLGATLIKAMHPDVHEISKRVLEHFHRLDPARSPARDIRKLAARLRDVTYGRVTPDNCRDWPYFERGDERKPEMVTVIFG